MRISDWSSDVCSSDLLTAFYCRFSGRLDEPTEIAGPAVSIGRCRRPRRGGQELHRRLCLRKLRDRLLPLSDRKSVVSGKSVSGRVDLGGRRIIKKKRSDKNRTVVAIRNNTQIR